jgi:membrane-associated phospholipid phosphatase
MHGFKTHSQGNIIVYSYLSGVQIKRFIRRCLLMGMGYASLVNGSARAQSPSRPQSSLQRLDVHILEGLEPSRTPVQTDIAVFIAKANNYVNAGIPASLLVAGLIRNDAPMKQNALYIASSTAVSYLLDYAIKKLVKRPRPFLTNAHLRPVYRPGEYSFPSGHSSSSFAAVTALSRAYSKWYVIAPSYLWAASVGYSRMYLGVHYPTDVVSGALLGVGSAFSMGFIRR